MTTPTDTDTVTAPGLNDDHLPFIAHLIATARQAGVTITYCCFNFDWTVMTRPDLDDAAGAAFLAALDVGEVQEPVQGESRTIYAGQRFAGGVELFVRPLRISTDTPIEDAP